MDQQIRSLLDEISRAEVSGDASVYERITEDGFIGIGPLGFVLGRDQWIGRLKEDKYECTRFDLSEIAVVEKGDVALAVAKADIESSYDGRPMPAPHTRVVHVFQRRAGDWRLLSVQHSAISQPPQS
jgi:hypothetical protein